MPPERAPSEDLSYVATSQGKDQEPGERHGMDPALVLQREHVSANTSISDF